jgi:hypothetical protein
MTIIGFVGTLGSGKTLSMTRECARYKARGFKLLTNYNLLIQDEQVDFDTLYKQVENEEDVSNTVLALDEIHILLDSRSSMSETSKVMTRWINLTRKQKIVLLYTTQYFHQVDRRLRSGTDIVVFCDGMLVNRDETKYFVCMNEYETAGRVVSDQFVGNEYFMLYDTNKIIKFTKPVKEKQVKKEKLKDERDFDAALRREFGVVRTE